MSAGTSITAPPQLGKDPPLHSRTPSSERAGAPTSNSPSNNPPTIINPSTFLQQSASKSMPPPPPQIQTTSASKLPLQSSEVPPTPSAPRPNFSPFFTLINDSTTQSTHHPSRIHYIFSDDDESEVLTAACVRSLQRDEDDSPAASRELEGDGRGLRESETSDSSEATFRKVGQKQKEKKGISAVRREERAIIVDINETGDGIVSTSSLSDAWQVINAEVTNAPTFNSEADDAAGEAEERGLMLRIEGVGISGGEGDLADSGDKRKGKAVGESGVMGEEEMQTLLEGFDRKMSLLRKIVASGESWNEARRAKTAAETGEGEHVGQDS